MSGEQEPRNARARAGNMSRTIEGAGVMSTGAAIELLMTSYLGAEPGTGIAVTVLVGGMAGPALSFARDQGWLK